MNTYTLMLRCPHLGSLSSLAESVIEENLLVLLENFESVVFDDVHNSWMDQSWATQISSRLYDDEGHVRLTGNQQEYWNAMKYGSAFVQQMAVDCDRWMSHLMADNHEKLLEVAEFYIVDELTVLRKLPHLWVVQLRGVRYG
ncbi:hypothetical protein D3C81_287450 [compost metagenome]